MTRQEMHIAFRLNYNSINANKPKAFLPQEIDVLLNREYNALVESFIKPKQTNPDAFTNSQNTLDSIKTLLVEVDTSSLPFNTNDPSRVAITLPVDYLHLVDDVSDTTEGLRKYYKVVNRLFSSNICNTILNTYLYTTTVRSPVSEEINNTLYVYKSGFGIDKVYIKYIRKYNPINEGQNCELPEFTHNTIVDNAVARAISIVRGTNNERVNNE